MACGIFLDQGSNQCPLHWQMDSFFFLLCLFIYFFFFKFYFIFKLNITVLDLPNIKAGEGVEKREPSYTVGGNAN